MTKNLTAVIQRARSLARPYCVSDGSSFRLARVDPGDTGSLEPGDKSAAETALRESGEALAALQDMLWAQDRWALLLIFQAMDAAGKDGAIKHVMSGVNPQGCQVASFKAPSAEELDHDYLWRCQRHLPERGRIGIFNRSYYEEVLIVRVHPEILAAQRLPEPLVAGDIWKRRHEDIRAHERYLSRNGIVIRKFFLHVSRDEQKKRFLERLDEPSRNWKFSGGDVRERGRWKEYMAAYEDAIRNTATPESPWYVVPADHKWFTRLVVSSAIIDALASLDLSYPKVSVGQKAELEASRRLLLAERDGAGRAPSRRRVR
jgi:PPK2 family polyphosphate:nucleotide phosphotransferase